VAAERPSRNDNGRQLAVFDTNDPQLDAPVVEKQPIACPCRMNQFGVGSENPMGIAYAIASGDAEFGSVGELDRRSLDRARADLRPAEILHDRNMASAGGSELPNPAIRLGM
jgi:hypothetical protein